MAKKNDKKELAGKSLQDLREEETKLRKELFDLRFKHGTRQLMETGELRKTRRQLARVLTLARQKQLEPRAEG